MVTTPVTKFSNLASESIIKKTVESLKNNGFTVEVFENGDLAKEKIFEAIPQQAQVLTMTSVTLDKLGISTEINESGRYISLRNKLNSMDRSTQSKQISELGATPEWAIGSVHAVTTDGSLLIASNTGSQLPAYVYSASNVIFVIGTQKLVKNLNEGFERIYKYTLPLEDKRSQKAYGVGSNVSKMLIINKEVNPKRIRIFLIKQKLGF